MNKIKNGDYVIKLDVKHSLLGKVCELRPSSYVTTAVVQWFGSNYLHNYTTNQLVVVTKKDNPEYFI
jgi:hypothetical protein